MLVVTLFLLNNYPSVIAEPRPDFINGLTKEFILLKQTVLRNTCGEKSATDKGKSKQSKAIATQGVLHIKTEDEDSWCHFKIAAFLVKRPDDGGAPKNEWNEEFSLLKKTSLLS